MNTDLIGVIALGTAAIVLWKQKKARAEAMPDAGAAGPRDPNWRITVAEAREIVARVNEWVYFGWFKPAEVLAIIEIESSFRPWAVRQEPQIGDASLGLMQLLSTTAADRGFRGNPESLLEPEINIRFGMAHLKWSWDYIAGQLGRDPTEDEWIGSYNAGVGNVVRKGFIPAGYVQKWRAAKGRYE